MFIGKLTAIVLCQDGVISEFIADPAHYALVALNQARYAVCENNKSLKLQQEQATVQGGADETKCRRKKVQTAIRHDCDESAADKPSTRNT